MENQRKYVGKWELWCMVFHLCIRRFFTTYPQTFGKISGTAGWITALFTGVLFLVLLYAVLSLNSLWTRLEKSKLFYAASAVYWVLAAVYTLREVTAVLHQVSYALAPDWFLMLFLLLGAIVPAICGARAVYRLHSLLVGIVAVFFTAIVLFSLRDAQLVNLFPVLGKGSGAVFGRGLTTAFWYLDIPFLAILTPRVRPEVKGKRTVLSAAIAGVLCTVLFLFISTLAAPYEFSWLQENPLYAMAKGGIGLKAVYLVGALISAMLYLMLALHLAAHASLRFLKARTKRAVGAGVLCLLLCFCLSGCYDSREVEESAYVIALGEDKGETAAYRYTFQISNPLETGKSTEMKEEAAPEEAEKSQSEEGNKGVNHMSIEADNVHLALTQLRSHLGKEPDLSHLKVIVFSKELAREGISAQAEILLNERQVPPDTNLCLADSAKDFLTQVKPSLEQSTARYYELLFREQYSPFAPVAELREFTADVSNSGRDAILPVANGEQIAGMGVFQGGTMVYEADTRGAVLYQLLCGQAKNMAVAAGDSVFSVTCRKKPQIQIRQNQGQTEIYVETSLRAKLLSGTMADGAKLNAQLEGAMTSFLQETAAQALDVLGICNAARRSYPTQHDWEHANWRTILKESAIFTKSRINLQKSV